MTSALVKFQTYARSVMQRERGATAVEYGLMVALIAIVIIGAVTFLGEELEGIFNRVGSSIEGAGADADAS